ncbi:hypothetical protein FRACYDRAFT_238480 [Fragilariopsis cylindrus CCMP1102]|uniref:Methyltransferase domain-containing protein n=1 Tax=Fragilariopsis cylindrus CCMP1102 TaxID=635003 RepID=A0A1E7FIT3_9STRA|nr:hypothetical protein FRACYDRAFT_238480 [Fragilariopsis cylindrus CCMP1102]|eukprot:OEU18047.1 hypothetical protein FRACYDRAFT_238480 [Fragilariopsis cylindrus CCMP1102]
MTTTSVGVVGSSYYDSDDELLLEVSSEKIYQQALEIWKEQKQQWEIWKRFARQLTMQHAMYITNTNDKEDVSSDFRISITDIVGAMEEGILTLERLEQQQSGGNGGGGRSSSSSNKEDDEARDSALSVLYTEYGRLLYWSSSLMITTTNNNPNSNTKKKKKNPNALQSPSHRCLALAKDPHTLLIGAPERIKQYNNEMKKLSVNSGDNKNNDDDNKDKLIISLFGPLCTDNAENAIRNAISLDATNEEADLLLTQITGLSSKDTVHKRKPTEFVAELFDSFADTFDTKLLETLKYQVPTIIGHTIYDLFNDEEEGVDDGSSKHNYWSSFQNVLDAGCGTGLAGRELRNVMVRIGGKRMKLVGVDASSKMLQIANKCTLDGIGCGGNGSSNSNSNGNNELLSTDTKTKNENENDDSTSSSSSVKLYDQLLEMDLEDMTIQNTLLSLYENENDIGPTIGFDLIVASDVFVYFGSLDTILTVFSNLHYYSKNSEDDEKDEKNIGSREEDDDLQFLNLAADRRHRAAAGHSGILIFTCEYATNEEAPLGYRLLPTGRFAHTKDYVISSAQANDKYKLKRYQRIIPREEKGIPVQGHLFVFEYSNRPDNTTNTDIHYISNEDDDDDDGTEL